MTKLANSVGQLSAAVITAPKQGNRRLVALAGPPASGKSTLAEILAQDLIAKGLSASVVPMDGFHLHNPLLVERGLLSRKGAPETFDLGGFCSLVPRLAREAEVHFPLFDRSRDIAIASAGRIDADCDVVILEGNYLLFDAPGWRDLSTYWDVSIWLDVPEDILRDRLIERWLFHGLSIADAEKRASENDLKNALLVQENRLPADLVYAKAAR